MSPKADIPIKTWRKTGLLSCLIREKKRERERKVLLLTKLLLKHHHCASSFANLFSIYKLTSAKLIQYTAHFFNQLNMSFKCLLVNFHDNKQFTLLKEVNHWCVSCVCVCVHVHMNMCESLMKARLNDELALFLLLHFWFYIFTDLFKKDSSCVCVWISQNYE